ncbi:hypothetical protein J3Q64DRAFT_1817445 [Phycomyces blakesleeanus]|uniref:F-box domain-containing protein n=2 Tax=Phycomyces blakesleeanus TaxID=4837 RepID=A0A167KRK4_PHYB8|nr:hypothetical protein PHYBLDRAFT_173135 [Phycomyces blakesleeanus NRRL 1555(-)]OAD68717.1 hypothetical protein PHYBLDRAFT_173135 [Phycomyces blakesleeanus NRRL 1555(-)]|eukprot:XP_018286757.1 hypothetical protein PHYBLDRAFT_173135 [Phycomyces blakesleeanus NRRL 1555(-)]
MTSDAALGTASRMVASSGSAISLGQSVLHRIFSHLSRSDKLQVALVCTHWSRPALELLWSSFTFVREREFERVFAIIARHNTLRPYATYVRSLQLTHADREFQVSPNIILLITSLCSNLESIAISFHHIRPSAPVAFPAPNLPNTAIRPILPPILRPHHDHPSSASRHSHSLPLAHFAHNCPKLRSIRLVSYSPKTDDSVYEMAKYLKSGTLETVVFSGCTTLQSSTLCKLAITNPQLRHIEIAGATPVSDSALATIADRCGATLEHLSIGNAHHISDKSMRYVARRCRALKQFCLFDNPDSERLSEECLVDVIKTCRSLEVVSISNARALGALFFDTVIARVEHELASIDHKNKTLVGGGGCGGGGGLQRLCLGNVKRDIIQSPAVYKLIKMSATEAKQHNDDSEDDDDGEDDDDENAELSNQSASSIMNSPAAFMPKMTVIRGSSIWWQRRRPLSKPKTR